VKIIIETIEHQSQRYPTIRDWQFKSGAGSETLFIKVSRLGNWRFEALIAVHELVEALLCKSNGISEEQVDRFDLDFEAKREPGDWFEPGSSPDAPYFHEHLKAERVEYDLARWLNVRFADFFDAIEEVTKDPVPYCSSCRARSKSTCTCPSILDND
jgi:hypothetical protein